MARNGSGVVVREYRTLHRLGVVGDHTDVELLDVFVHGVGEERELAFAALIDRHGAMVLRVCSDVLRNHHEAQDAAQATFLVLASKGGSIRRAGSLGSWLYGVARRVSAHARADASRRRRIEREACREIRVTPADALRLEQFEAIYEELDRLPSRYRSAIVACDLEGWSHAEAAARLAVPLRTLQTRLYRGRERLRMRLIRRGVTLGAAGLAGLLGGTGRAAVSARWLEATAQAAARIAEGTVALSTGLVSTRVLAWVRAWCRARTVLRAGLAAVGLSAAGLILGGSLALANRYGAEPQVPPVAPATAQVPAAPPASRPKPAPTSAIARPLPAPDELQRVLREVAEEAIKLAKAKPDPGSWTLARIAETQARAGDRPGARTTYAAAVEQARSGKEHKGELSTLRFIGNTQADCGMHEEARETLRAAVALVPPVSGDFDKDHWAELLLCEVIRSLSRAGDREHAREALQRLDRFVDDGIRATRIGNADAVMLPELAGAHAAAGDFDGAFAVVDRVKSGKRGLAYQLGHTLGEIAQGTRYLRPLETRRFVRRIAEELGPLKDPAWNSSALIYLAEAQARLGDIEDARKSAMAIGSGPTSSRFDVTSGQPYALILIAERQKEAGDRAGARETLRMAHESVRRHPAMSGPAGRLFQVASAQAGVGDLDGAIRSVEAIGKGRKAEALATIALAQAVSGRTEAARATLKEAMEDARIGREHPPAPEITLPATDGSKLMPASDDQARKLAMVQGMAGDLDQALATARSIEDANWKRWALSDVVKSRAQAGDPAEALRLARGLEAPEDRRAALESLAEGLSTRLQLERAR
jgi:RNA polymerase sigma factor (sigma-70 family)